MGHYVPKRRKFIDRRNLVQNIVLGVVLTASVVLGFISGNPLFKIIGFIIIAILTGTFFSGVMIRFLTGRGYAIASAINELLYIFVAIPIIVMAATYLPVSIYLTFFGTQWSSQILIGIFFITGMLMLGSILYLIKGHLRDKKMGLFSYIAYLFDFEKRAQERIKQKERVKRIDEFYAGFHQIESAVAAKMEKRMTGFQEFDWKARLEQEQEQEQEQEN
ncbi:MAG: hypothetical protein ACTSQ6_08915 [Candidatus Heimdallarchaeaceae archaeon]